MGSNRSRPVVVDGVEYESSAAAARALGLSKNAITQRIARNGSADTAHQQQRGDYVGVTLLPDGGLELTFGANLDVSAPRVDVRAVVQGGAMLLEITPGHELTMFYHAKLPPRLRIGMRQARMLGIRGSYRVLATQEGETIWVPIER